MNKFVAASLIGYASSTATPGPLPGTDFPKYATITGVGSTQLDNNNVLQTYIDGVSTSVSNGPYRGFRNGMYVFPTQTLVAATSSAVQTVTTAAANTRAFYQLTQAAQGGFPTKANDTSGQEATGATGAKWLLCQTAQTALTACNGGLGWKASGGTATKITNRLVFQAGTNAAITIGTVAQTHAWTWNQDMLLASLSQIDWPTAGTKVTDGTAWCSGSTVSLPNAGTDVAFSATLGLNGKTKCSWQLKTADGSKAPGFTAGALSYSKFQLQWIEFLTSTGLGTGGVMPTSDGANYYVGAYTGNWLNPLTSQASGETNFQANAGTWYASVTGRDPRVQFPGSVGTAAYYSGMGTIFTDTNVATVDSGFLMNTVKTKQNEFNSFNAVAATYNTAKTEYNDAVTKENERLKDIFKAAFDPKTVIPTRPTPPTAPGGYMGPYLALDSAVGTGATAWAATAAAQGDKAYLQYTASTTTTRAANANQSNRMGYLVSCADTAGTCTGVGAGHVFGVLGQATCSQPGTAKGFAWGVSATSNTPQIQVSIFPDVEADAGITTTNENLFSGKAQDWAALNSWTAPGTPANPTAPMDPPSGAAALAVGFSAALVIASLQ